MATPGVYQKEILVNKILLFLLLSLTFAINAQEQNICRNPDIMFGYFNGVLTQQKEADDALIKFKERYGTETDNGQHIEYELFYNHTRNIQDFTETFKQRLAEHKELEGRYELFFEALRGSGTWWDRLTKAVTAFVDIFADLTNKFLSLAIRSLTALAGTSHTIEDYAKHQQLIDKHLLYGSKLLLVAHSQGNLFSQIQNLNIIICW